MKTSALSKFLNLLLEESDYRKTSYFAGQKSSWFQIKQFQIILQSCVIT